MPPMTCSNGCKPRKPRRHFIRVEYEESSSDNASGEPVTTTKVHLRTRANITPSGVGAETTEAMQRQGFARYDVYIDYNPTAARITKDMTIVVTTLHDLTLDIDGPPVFVEGERKELRISGYQRT